MKTILYIFIFFIFSISLSQEISSDNENEYIRISGDTIVKGSIGLNEVLLLPKRPFKNSEEIRRYLILKRKTLKVYDYAILASDRLNSLNVRLSTIKSKRQKKRYTRLVEKFLKEELTEELSKLTRSEGAILIKLIHRQTGITPYELIKDLRNGISAFFYNTTAKFFDMNLKTEFLPYKEISDYYIEDIIQRSIRDGVIKYSKPVEYYDLYELKNFWQ